MKNKIARLVVGFVFLLAPVAHAADAPVTVYPHWHLGNSSFLHENFDYSPDTYSLNWITDYAYGYGVVQEEWYWQPDYFGDEIFRYTLRSWTDGGWPLTVLGVETWHQWGDITNRGTNINLAPLNIPYEYCAMGGVYSYFNVWGEAITDTSWRGVETLLACNPGGPNGSSNISLIRLQPVIVDQTTNHAIVPPTSIYIDGIGYCDSNGYAYLSRADNSAFGCTPSAPSTYLNYTFSVGVTKAPLEIRWHGTNIAGQTHTVIVGEQILLTCDWDTTHPNFAPITNFLWTVPAPYVGNFVATNSTSLLVTNIMLTNSTVNFYWYRPATNLVVECSAISQGQTMTKKTTFNVIAPSFTFTICPSNVVALDSQYGDGGLYLHFGNITGAPGMTFKAVPSSLVESNFGGAFMQIISSSQTKRWSSPIRQIRSITNAYDNAAVSAQMTNGAIIMEDSPREPAPLFYDGITRQDNFSTYLMYKSSREPSIYVPLSKASWSWGGGGTNVLGWSLANAVFSPTNCQNSTSWPEFPAWSGAAWLQVNNWTNF